VCPQPIVREASEALAVHLEHRRRDLMSARDFTVRLLGVGDSETRRQAGAFSCGSIARWRFGRNRLRSSEPEQEPGTGTARKFAVAIAAFAPVVLVARLDGLYAVLRCSDVCVPNFW
jgi:hypothetical protein